MAIEVTQFVPPPHTHTHAHSTHGIYRTREARRHGRERRPKGARKRLIFGAREVIDAHLPQFAKGLLPLEKRGRLNMTNVSRW
jgi:hypothetical protein